jgi:hypothetical protein
VINQMTNKLLNRYETDNLAIARRLAAQVTIARHLGIAAWAITSINFDGASCLKGGPAHDGSAYIGAFHISDPVEILNRDDDDRSMIAVAGAVADLIWEEVEITDAAVHARLTEADCALASVPKAAQDELDGVLSPHARDVASLLLSVLAEEWCEAAGHLLVDPDHFEAVYVPTPRKFSVLGPCGHS